MSSAPWSRTCSNEYCKTGEDTSGSSEIERPTVGFIGLGRMGLPMAQNLLRAGFPLVVHNRSRGNVDVMSSHGAVASSSPSEVTGLSDVVLTCLPDVPAVEQVFFGESGVLTATRPGQILVDHSTVGPSTSQQIAVQASERRVQFLDAPISGGVERAADATLTIMVGGDRQAYATALSVLEIMADKVSYVGPSGAGSVVKLVNQLMVGIHSLAAAEALVLGVKGGADPDMLVEIIQTSWGQSFMMERNGPTIIDRNFSGARAQVRTILKDLNLIQDFAKTVGTPIVAGDQAAQVFQEANDKGLAGDDLAAIVKLLEEAAGCTVERRDAKGANG